MSQEWYYSIDGDRQGPVEASELKKLAEAGTLKAADLVWKDGMADWVAAKSIKGLFNGGGAAVPAASKSGEQARPRPADEDEERPRSRRRDEDDEEEERPMKSRRRDDDEEERPAKSRRRDEDDDDVPARSRDAVDWDDDRPRKKKKRRIPEDAASKKMSTSLVAIIASVFGLGWIGIHKFMLGKTQAGLIMLLGSVLTCGIGAIVFNVIALIEGIIYITKSDEEFYETYVIGDKDWF